MNSDILNDIGELFDGSTITADDAREYMIAIRGAVEVHVDRERKRHGLWKEYGAEDQIRQIKLKSERIMKMYEQALKESRELNATEQAAVVEECQDMINYSVFGIRTV